MAKKMETTEMSTDAWIYKQNVETISTMDYYSALKRDEILHMDEP